MNYDEITKYHSKMNEVKFNSLSSVEMDLFFSLCTKVKENGSHKITIPFTELKNISKYSSTSQVKFIEDLRKTNRKLLSLQFCLVNENGTRIIDFSLFPTFDINTELKTLTVSVNEDFTFLLNQPEFFTQFELKEFVTLRSSYAKTLFRLLKQFRTTGHLYITIDDFKNRMEIPSTYAMSDIDKKVIKPSLKELEPYFKNLKIKKNKKGQGGRVNSLEFHFNKEIIPKHTISLNNNNTDNKRKPKKEVIPSDFYGTGIDTPASPEMLAIVNERISKLKSSNSLNK